MPTNAQRQARWRAKNPERAREITRRATQKIWFGGNRELAVQRDGEKCVECRMTRQEHKTRWGRDITVDHIDGNGRYTPPHQKNNNLDNLRTLCLSCHGKKDRQRLQNPGFRKLDEQEARFILQSKGRIKQADLSQMFGLTSQSAISLIQSGKNWKHIKEKE